MDNFFVQPVEKKVSAVAWWQPQVPYSDGQLYFYSGTWDQGHANVLTLWTCPSPDIRSRQLDQNFEARIVAQTCHTGDVADVLPLSNNMCATASADGRVYVYHAPDTSASNGGGTSNESTLEKVQCISRLSSAKTSDIPSPATSMMDLGNGSPAQPLITAKIYEAPCTALSLQPHCPHDPELASVGEDGRLCLHRIGQSPEPMASVVADSLPLYDVAWLSSHTLMTAGRSGQLKVFDRRDCQQPMTVLVDPEDANLSVTCLAVHPSQANRIATGNEFGNMLIWDIRQLSEPYTNSVSINEKGFAINDLLFHPNQPFTVIAASDDATCTIIDTNACNPSAFNQNPLYQPTAARTSTTGIRTLRNLYNWLGINSLDYHPQANALLAGSDSENLLYEFE
ncbi:hypothetical protein H4R34_004705 [Dimargaris verticillata]|uniref:WD40-repeat-containing domain protein n=1 Tax=Dimargaris verticillata TaxID=2761393 RepID=A0A9W8E7V1_9FUNG|nr:hypothetical protein H4R34_004705 [Dimargaris verticillata]